MNPRLSLTSAAAGLIFSLMPGLSALADPSDTASKSWSKAPRAFVMLRPDAPGRPDEFIQTLEAAGGHVSVLIPGQAAWVYADDEVLAKPVLRRWIGNTHRARIPDSEIAGTDIQEARAARSWNQALEISDALRTAGGHFHGLTGDALPRPISREHRAGSLTRERVSLSVSDSSTHLPLGADSIDTSLFMAGTVAVGVWLIEAAGSEYDWSDEEEAQSIGGVMAGMDAWVGRGGESASLSFIFDIHAAVPVSGVPILENDPDRWMSEAMAHAGFPGPQPSLPGSYPAYYQAITYNNWIRDQLRTNWCFSIFIVDSDPSVNEGQLPGGRAAWAYLGGPIVYMSRFSTWAAQVWVYYGVVPMHEVGHIFWATDEYDGNSQRAGYLNVDDDPSDPLCVMNRSDSTTVCQASRDQLGWRDLDQDGIIEVLDTPPSVTIDPTPIPGRILTWSGSASVGIVPSQNPFFHWVTIDQIDRVEIRVDAGPWIEAVPADGAWDGYVEGFQWGAPPLCQGSHVLRARAHTVAGNVSDVFSIEVQTPDTGGTCGPWVSAPDLVSVQEGMVVEFPVSAADPDGEPIEQIHADMSDLPAPNDASFQAGSGAAGTFHWATTSRDSGIHQVVFTATNSLSGSASTSIHVANVDQPPAFDAPASIEGTVGAEIHFDVVAADPDGDPITSLAAENLPAFATFDLNSGGASGRFQWTPVDFQTGSHVVTFWAFNLLQGSASTTIRVQGRSPNPVVTAPDTIQVEAGQEVSFLVEVFEPAGELVEVTASGLPPRATFQDNGDWTWLFRWLPEESDRSGSPYLVSFLAANPYGLIGQTTTVLRMAADRPPVVVLPAEVTGTEGQPLEVAIEAVDPDGDPIQSLSASPLPAGSVFDVGTDSSHGTLSWTPGFAQSGQYSIQFVARSTPVAGGPALDGSAALQLTIVDSGRPPVAQAGGPYRGVVGQPIAFDGSGSFDPDGDPLLLTWDFGDGTQAAGVSPTHAYAGGGTFVVTLNASDGLQLDTDSTSTQVMEYLEAEAFLAGRHRTISLAGGASAACLQLEPVGASYENGTVDVGTVVMHSEGAGEISEIFGDAGKSAVSRDLDQDGVDEIAVCFQTADLRRLFSGLSGRSERRVFIRGRLVSGAPLQAVATLTIIAGGTGISVSSNPVASRATVTWRAEKSGLARVRLFDVRGRLVRTLYENPHSPAGYHDIELNPGGSAGARLAAGVYFLRLETETGEQVRRVAVVR